MAKRVSHSLLDPCLTSPIKRVYPALGIPRGWPPEMIVLAGHLLAIVGACGFLLSVGRVWGGVLIAVGVAGNHVMDCVDGTHARATDQCRNGGELLDHFMDPLSFAYWLGAWSIAVGHAWLGILAVIVLYATAVLTNIKAKLTGEFTLARFGPTEFKTLLVVFGLAMAAMPAAARQPVGFWALLVLTAVGAISLAAGLLRAVLEVNRSGGEPDTTEWESGRTRP